MKSSVTVAGNRARGWLGPGWKQGCSILVVPDVHYPVHDWRAVDLLLQVAAEYRFDAVVQLGDLLDLEALGRWTAHAPRQVEGDRLVGDIILASEFLGKLLKASRVKNEQCRGYLLEGNHEYRIERLLDSTPYLEGIINLAELLKPKELGFEFLRVHDEQGILRFDWTPKGIRPRYLRRTDWASGLGVAFTHGWYCNVHAAKQHCDRYGRGPIIFGHTHRVQQYVAHSYGHPKPMAATIGHLRLADPSWMQGPLSWQLAFAIATMGAETGVWDLEIVRINRDERGDYHCIARGKQYTVAAGRT